MKIHQFSGQVSKRVNFWMFLLFPTFLNILMYQTTIQNASWAHTVFVASSSGFLRFLFSSLLLTMLFAVLTAFIKRVWLAALLMGVPFYVLAVADYFKMAELGTRIALDDLLMVFNLGDLWSPDSAGASGIAINNTFLITAGALLLYVALLYFFKIHTPVSTKLRRQACVLAAVLLVFPFTTKSVAYQVFSSQIEGYEQVSSHSNEMPLNSIDCLIGSAYYDSRYPDSNIPYTEEDVSSILARYEAQTENTSLQETPDVIVVMSESFFDLTTVSGLFLTENIYRNFRRMRRGEIVVPAFGGGTSATEFEVLSGTSNRALFNTKSPYKRLDKDDEIWSYQEYFSDLGYHSTYIHPFKSYFYNRKDAFTAMGFDRLIFEDNMTVEREVYDRDIHTSDHTLTQQIIACLEEGSNQPQFIWATSMQNHSPYTKLSDEDRLLVWTDSHLVTESEMETINTYANGIADTDKALGELLDYVDSREKPTAVIFFGDHHPLLEGYERLEHINSNNIYDSLDNLATPYGIYTNFEVPGAQESEEPERMSAFYLLEYAAEYLGLPENTYMAFLEECRENLPVYSSKIVVYGDDEALGKQFENELLTLSYDRYQGEGYSLS